jgi:hypothetical protein
MMRDRRAGVIVGLFVVGFARCAFGGDAGVSFRTQVIPALSRAGCNMGACHGTPTGKGGFRLSLRGYLPEQDHATIARESGGRRAQPLDPDASLLLQKPLGEVAHEGGVKLVRGSIEHRVIRDWIAAGMPDDPGAPRPVALSLSPGPRVMEQPESTQPVSVTARYADGTERDVTALCYFDSSRPQVATIGPDAVARFHATGEVAIVAHFLDLVATVRFTLLAPAPDFIATAVPDDHPIDRAVFEKLNQMRIPPSGGITDDAFLRRVTIDLIGRLPTPDEVQAFRDAPFADRRERLIDDLLDRDEFTDFWTMKLADVLRSNGRLLQPKGAAAFHRWVRAAVASRRPLDAMARDLLTAEGSSFADPAASYYRIARDPEAAVETTAQLFLGIRIQCAKCHNHPFERWTQDDYYGFAAFFGGIGHKKGPQPGEEIIFATGDGTIRQPRSGAVMPPRAPGGPGPEAGAATTPTERRAWLASWLTGPENPFFARGLANRVWYHLAGRGVVEPVDDFRDSNPACNDELLDALATELRRSGYDLRSLLRFIATSRTYQRSAKSVPGNDLDEPYFAHAMLRPLPAEVLLDAIGQVTGSPTVFDGLPPGTRAVQLPDGKIENAFLKSFGKPARELACECERETGSNLSQALQLIGGATVQAKLRDDDGRIARLARSDASPEAIVRELYLAALARDPEPTELAAARSHLDHASATPRARREAIEDVAWALLNAQEFLFQH